MKTVLVIMTTYNGEKYLAEQLDSLLGQEGVNVSILVRDDGSKDGTRAVLDQYQSEGKLTWYTGEHLNVQKGFFDLMKKAAQHSWDYIAFCDQDDVWDLDKLSIAVKQLEGLRDDLPALYYCGQRLVDGERNFLADHYLNDRRSHITRFVLSDFAGCTGVFNRALLDAAIGFEPEYMLMHDTWVLKVCLCLGGSMIVDPAPHMEYRQHGGNTVGLGRSLPAYCKQVKQYLNEYKVEQQMRELLRGYEDKMIPEYKELAHRVCDYRKNWSSKRKLLDRKYIDFYSAGLDLTYWLKVMLNKL